MSSNLKLFLAITIAGSLLLAAPGMGQAADKLQITFDLPILGTKSVQIDIVEGNIACPQDIQAWSGAACTAWNFFNPEIENVGGVLQLKLRPLGQNVEVFNLSDLAQSPIEKEYKLLGIVIAKIKIELVTVGVFTIPNPLQADTFQELVERLIDFAFVIGIALASLMVLVAGLLFLTAAGRPEKITQAKKVLFWTVVGFSVILLAKGIIAVVKSVLGA